MVKKLPATLIVEIEEKADLFPMSPLDCAKLQRYRVSTVIGAAAWIEVACLAAYLAITLIHIIAARG